MLIAHVDMDCFFVACEIKRNPSLEGKPVIVGAAENRGVVCSASYEARKFGIHSAMPSVKAQKLCPQGIFLPVNHKYYYEESKQVMKYLRRLADDMEQVSVDEAYLNVTNFAAQFKTPEEMGKWIQLYIKERTQLPCSLGIAHCRTVAKIGTDYAKPAGVKFVADAPAFLAPLAIEKFPGIGKVSKLYYHEKGVHTIGDLARMNRFVVLEKFGHYGVHFQQIALGEVTYGLYHRTSQKSTSREHTFPQDIKDIETLLEILDDLCEQVHDDLENYAFKTVSIKLRDDHFNTITRDYTLKMSSRSLYELKLQARKLLIDNYSGTPVRLLGVKLGKLLPQDGVQMQLSKYSESEKTLIHR